MSNYGLKIKNSLKAIIIDDIYNNFSYYQHGTDTLSIGTNTIPISATSDNLILVVKPVTNAFIAPYGFSDTTTQGTFESIIIATDAICDCEWILYKEGESHPTGDYGLKIKNIDNDVIFNSNEIGYATITNIHYIVQIGSEYGINLDDTDSYVLISNPDYKSICGSGVFTDYVRGFKRSTDNRVIIGWVIISTGSSVSTGTNNTSRVQYFLEFRPPPSL